VAQITDHVGHRNIFLVDFVQRAVLGAFEHGLQRLDQVKERDRQRRRAILLRAELLVEIRLTASSITRFWFSISSRAFEALVFEQPIDQLLARIVLGRELVQLRIARQQQLDLIWISVAAMYTNSALSSMSISGRCINSRYWAVICAIGMS
jgi:hypothetical protein